MIKRNKKFRILSLILLALILAFSLIMMYIERIVLPRGAEILHSYAETNMFEILNETIGEISSKYAIDYNSLVDITYSPDGSVSTMSVNYNKVNTIKSEIAMDVSHKLSGQDEVPMYVPIGSFCDNIYLVGKGPKIKFILVQRGCVQIDFEHSFESAGLNQTMHTLKVTLDADVALVLPFYDTHTYMKTSAILAQTVINGNVPDYYSRKDIE